MKAPGEEKFRQDVIRRFWVVAEAEKERDPAACKALRSTIVSLTLAAVRAYREIQK